MSIIVKPDLSAVLSDSYACDVLYCQHPAAIRGISMPLWSVTVGGVASESEASTVNIMIHVDGSDVAGLLLQKTTRPL